MNEYYLGHTVYRVWHPESPDDDAQLRQQLADASGLNIGPYLRKGWFHATSPHVPPDLSDQIVAVALGRSMPTGDTPLLFVRRADASVSVRRTHPPHHEIDTFILPETSVATPPHQ